MSCAARRDVWRSAGSQTSSPRFLSMLGLRIPQVGDEIAGKNTCAGNTAGPGDVSGQSAGPGQVDGRGQAETERQGIAAAEFPVECGCAGLSMGKDPVEALGGDLDVVRPAEGQGVLAQFDIGDQFEIGGEVLSSRQGKRDVSVQKGELGCLCRASKGTTAEPSDEP